jgi:hypothetical protein
MNTPTRLFGPGLLASGIALLSGCSGEKTIHAPPLEQGTVLDAKTRIEKNPRLKEDMQVVGEKRAKPARKPRKE